MTKEWAIDWINNRLELEEKLIEDIKADAIKELSEISDKSYKYFFSRMDEFVRDYKARVRSIDEWNIQLRLLNDLD